MPTVSVIVPIYNVELYLNRCINSLIHQSLYDIEIILIDDGSSDNCPQMCDEWAMKDKRIKVIHKQNEGLGYARNSGLEIAKGKYVAFVDSDDYVEPDMYKRLIDASHNGEIDAVYCGLIQEKSSKHKSYIHDYESITTFSRNYMNLIALSFLYKTELNTKDRLFMSVWHAIYKRDIINRNNIKFYSEREISSEDLPFQIAFCLNSSLIRFIPDHLYYYCSNSTSLTHRITENKIIQTKNLRALLLQQVKGIPDGELFVNAEYYSRIRSLCSEILTSRTFSFGKKLQIASNLCNDLSFQNLDLSLPRKDKTWKYLMHFYLIHKKYYLTLILFSYFDKYINKQNLLFWKKMY